MQRAIREARLNRVLNEDKSGWHVIVKFPNGERISRYIKKESCYQVQALANLKCTYVSLGIFKLLKYRKYRYCYMLLCLLTNQSTMYVVWPSFQLKRDGFFLIIALKKTFYWDQLLKYFFAFFFYRQSMTGLATRMAGPSFLPCMEREGWKS